LTVAIVFEEKVQHFINLLKLNQSWFLYALTFWWVIVMTITLLLNVF